MLLQISKRTLQRYRSVGALPYKTLGKKTYYSEEDVLTFLSNHQGLQKEDIASTRLVSIISFINNPLKHFSDGKEKDEKDVRGSP